MGRGRGGAAETKAAWFPRGKGRSRSALRRFVPLVRKEIGREREPAVTRIARRGRGAFRVLVATVISARTKDEVTGEASARLFRVASAPRAMMGLSAERIARLIYPAGFYRTKARAIKALSRTIVEDFSGRVPETIEELLTLPGVGRKTANLVVTLGFGKPGICVDTHVHRIVNRLGAVRTKSPAETEFALRAVLPAVHWIEINDLLVTFGRAVCTPLSPWCSRCSAVKLCERIGVARSR